MFLQSLTEHQFHILERIIAVAGLFLGFLALLTFLSRRHSREKKKTPRRNEQLGQTEIMTKDGWRTKANRKKRKKINNLRKKDGRFTRTCDERGGEK